MPNPFKFLLKLNHQYFGYVFMKKILTVFILSIFGNNIYAQETNRLNQLLLDTNITWIGEYETYIPFDVAIPYLDSLNISNFIDNTDGATCLDVESQAQFKKLGAERVRVENIKQMRSLLSNDIDGVHPGLNPCNQLVYQWVLLGKLKAYLDGDLTRVLTKKELDYVIANRRLFSDVSNPYNTHKIGVSDDGCVLLYSNSDKNFIGSHLINDDEPDHLEAIVQTVDFHGSISLPLTKAKHLIYFNKSNKIWYINTLSIGLVAPILDSNYQVSGYESLFWVPVYESTHALNYSDANYPQARRTAIHVEFDKAKVLKSDNTYQFIIQSILNEIRDITSKKEIYQDVLGSQRLELGADFGCSEDSIIVQSPNSRGKNVKVLPKVDVEHITQIKLIQDWYWDEMEMKLRLNNVGYALMVDRVWRGEGIRGQILIPLFYEKFMETKFDKMN